MNDRWKLVFPNQFTGVKKGSRLPVIVSREKIFGKTSHTQMVFSDLATDKQRANIVAWLSSTHFTECLEYLAVQNKVKRLSGGYELLPEYAERLVIPKAVLESEELFNLSKDLLKKKTVPLNELWNIDAKIEGLVNPDKKGTLFVEVVPVISGKIQIS